MSMILGWRSKEGIPFTELTNGVEHSTNQIVYVRQRPDVLRDKKGRSRIAIAYLAEKSSQTLKPNKRARDIAVTTQGGFAGMEWRLVKGWLTPSMSFGDWIEEAGLSAVCATACMFEATAGGGAKWGFTAPVHIDGSVVGSAVGFVTELIAYLTTRDFGIVADETKTTGEQLFRYYSSQILRNGGDVNSFIGALTRLSDLPFSLHLAVFCTLSSSVYLLRSREEVRRHGRDPYLFYALNDRDGEIIFASEQVGITSIRPECNTIGLDEASVVHLRLTDEN